jgi:hypothetical protein
MAVGLAERQDWRELVLEAKASAIIRARLEPA